MIKDYGMILASLTIFSKCMVPATRVDAKKKKIKNKRSLLYRVKIPAARKICAQLCSPTPESSYYMT